MRPILLGTLLILTARGLFGQGGPPMITDDPGTPGNGKWENNFAIILEHRSGETSIDLPQFDLNYGVGEHIQLTLQTAPVLLKREGHGAIGGLGSTEAAVKWRMLDEENAGVDLSTFPRIIFNIVHSSVRRGLADDGTRFQIPFEVAKKFGSWHVDAEFGPFVSTVGRSEWLYGVAGGFEVTKKTMIMAELHGTSRTNFSRDDLAINFGLRQELTKSSNLIVSLGHELRSPEDSLALIGYFGIQLLF
ncbi:MAG TPA: hypothetical protein VGM62_17565 [Chthoniobacterales bacterium]